MGLVGVDDLMALAYAVVFADSGLFDRYRAETVQQAQQAADRRFEAIAQESFLTKVTRNPEPRVMTYPEMRNAFPNINLTGLVGLYFTADIT
ncbi:hypothetical protein FDJ44_gp39 [Microbacterium phage Pikmin]|uniref:Uncharacterized protein n=2 Tax=Pikminvirus pikmin TaxID=2560596 RepID=A0A2P1CL63_9CAUD|nr:hypothetical protein FDJ44_gp39 [Microbacterium phage Pikmin]AVJ51177.1 hypothetical protein PBI_PIKMIN_39 [Microbacterium phage Pikmin]AVJ51735.1 hypothetical protein PBI_CASEY_39 [Microbacterium phage Casey]